MAEDRYLSPRASEIEVTNSTNMRMRRTRKRHSALARKVDVRWALRQDFDWGPGLLGRFCWPEGAVDDPPVRTFATREEARDAKADCCYGDTAKVVKVCVHVEEVL